MPTVNSVSYNKPVLPRVSDTSDLASNRASVYSGKGLSFDGVNDKIDSDFSFVGTQATISFYLSWDSYGTNNVEFILEGNANSNFMIHLGGGSGTNGIRFVMNSSVGQNLDVTNGVQPGLNHYVLTTDNSTASLYINGKLFNSQSKVLGQANTPYLGIGYRRNSPSYYLNGRLSGLKIFDQALTATQVAELYNNPEQILPTGVSAVNLKLWLPMMEGAGSYVYNGAAGATGTELVSNGGFDEVCQKWGLSDVATIAITGGKAVWTNPASGGAFADQYISATTGKTYRVTFDYTASDSGFVYIGDQYVSIPSGNGTFTTDITYTSGSARVRLAYGSASALTASIDNVSVKEVVPQATGTISGATWVSGLPEPLPQTALMDWNKATNKFAYSEDYTQAAWDLGGLNAYVNQGIAPNGTWTANSFVSTTGSGAHVVYQFTASSSSGTFTFSAYVKKVASRYVEIKCVGLINDWVAAIVDLDTAQVTKTQASSWTGLTTSVVSAGDGWYRLSITGTGNSSTTQLHGAVQYSNSGTATISSTYADVIVPGTGLVDYLVWGLQLEESSTASPYLPTYASAQASPVLIPKGLTTGKDIFGNSIAVPRSSGAFNFDGYSWAYIDENASHKLASTDNITLEGWFRYTSDGRTGGRPIFGKRWAESNWLRFYYTDAGTLKIEGAGGGGQAATIYPNIWYHIVGVATGGGTLTLYKDGVLIGSTTVSGYTMDFGGALEIGAWSSEYKTNGQLSNVRVYPYALTAEQVADNYNQKATTFGGSTTISELQAYINRTNAAGATVEAHPSLLNTLTELDSK